MKRFCMALSLVALVVGASTAAAQRPGGGGGFGAFGGGVGGLIRMEEVQKELGISEEQKTKLTEGLRGAGGAGGQRGENLSREDLQKRVEEMTKKTDELVKTVLDAKQQARLAELRVQRAGAAALAQADVAEKLGLDQAQKDKIKKIQEDSAPGRGAFNREASQEDRQKLFTEMREKREKANAELVAVLTADQKAAFEKLQGAKFTFPQGGPGGGRQRNNN